MDTLFGAAPLVPPTQSVMPSGPAPDAMPKKRGLFGSAAPYVFGALSDALAMHMGERPTAIANIMAMQEQRRQTAEQERLMSLRQAQDFGEFQREYDYRAAHPAPSDDAFTRAMQMAGIDLNSEQGKQLALQRAQALAADPNDAFVATSLPGDRFYAGPKSGLAAALGGITGGGHPDTTPTVEDGYQYTPGPGGRANQANWKQVGGAASPGTPPFRTSAAQLDNITMMSESGGNPNAVSPAGARGLMQVMPSTARNPGFGIKPSNGTAADDARVGLEYRRVMQARYQSLPKMWAAYNAGPGRVDSALQYGADWLSHLPSETQSYVARNMRAVRGY